MLLVWMGEYNIVCSTETITKFHGLSIHVRGAFTKLTDALYSWQ